MLHIAAAEDWAAAQASDTREYRMSTRGRSLDEEGFIHCSADRAQADDVLRRYYTDAPEALVLLAIDPARVPAQIKVEGGFPHIYGPLPVDAVIKVEPVTPPRTSGS